MLFIEKDNYNTYYKNQLEKAQEYQDFVTDKLHEIGISVNCYGSKKYQYEKGESRSGIEIKFDDKRKDTHNLYIEYAEKSNPNNKSYVPSGIERKDNTWLYVVGDYEVIYIFTKSLLQGLKNTDVARHVITATSKGYLLPKPMADKYAGKIIYC